MLARFRETGVRRVCALEVLDFFDALHHFDSCRRKAPLSLGEAFRQALEPAERQAYDEDHDERPDGEQNRAHAPIDPHEIGEAGEEGYGGVGRVAGEMGDEGVDRARVVGDYLPDLSRGRLIDGPQRNAAERGHEPTAQIVAQVRLGHVGQSQPRAVQKASGGDSDNARGGPAPERRS